MRGRIGGGLENGDFLARMEFWLLGRAEIL